MLHMGVEWQPGCHPQTFCQDGFVKKKKVLAQIGLPVNAAKRRVV